jgi:hypothetical protein
MQSLVTDRQRLLRLAGSTLEQIESGAFSELLLESAQLEGADAGAADRDSVANALSAALDWARMEGEVTTSAATLEAVAAVPADIPYLPSNQVLAVLQSAWDEYAEERARPEAGELEVPFDDADPGWVSVAWERLRAALRGKRRFISHTSADSFRYDLPSDAVVALFSDWGTGEATAKRVMQQIRAANPTHAIHLGDVYYSGTPNEINNRFLAVIDEFGPPRDSCRYFALNSNHEMYSGGYGYFDTTLQRFGQDASYFNLGNEHWRLIGLDSGHEDHGLRDPQREWLAAQLDEQGPKPILLTHHQLFSPYESRASDRKLFQKTADLLPKVYAWFWGHEHKCIIFGDHLGIKARCIGHGAIPSAVPYGQPGSAQVPILNVDERVAPDGGGIHGFALLRFAGSRVEVSYIDEFGTEFFAETLGVPAPRSVLAARSILMPSFTTQEVQEQPPQAEIVGHYKRLLKRREMAPGTESLGGLEDASSDPDLSPSAIDDRVNETRAELHRIIKKHLGDQSELHEIADQIADEGRDSLHVLGREAPEDITDLRQITAAVEVIVRTDGSRPSFMVRDGAVDTTTSPVGTWADTLNDSAALLTDALSCIGRIDVPGSSQGFEGTGFLIHENLIVTNRHVLQAIARPNAAGVWTFKTGVTIDFGHEFRGRTSISPRGVKRVVFAATKVINSPIDHTKLDLVLIELEPAKAADKPRSVLAVDIAPDWASPAQIVYTAGYPGNPGFAEPLSLLEQLFQSTFGCKRLAPGEIQSAHSGVHIWTLAHDASTLGGNSGSAVLVAGRERAAAGLHYGGTRADPRENWGHVLGRVLDETDKISGKTLRECLNSFGVELIDRTRAHAANR